MPVIDELVTIFRFRTESADIKRVEQSIGEVRNRFNGLAEEWTGAGSKMGAGLSGATQQLTATSAAVEKQTGRMGGAFRKLGGAAQNAAGKVPGLGGALTLLASPAGGAAAAIGAVSAAVGLAVNRVSNLEKELRPMIARSGLSAESLQVLSEAAKRLGSEDGLDGVTDSSQELQLRLAEAVQDGTGPAVAAFEKLGLSSEELIKKSPEESFLAVITALQGVNNEADKKFLADELLGGASERLSGVLSVNADEFANLTSNIRENSDIVSNQGIASAQSYNQAMTGLKDALSGTGTAVATAVMPVLTQLITGITTAIPVIRDTFAPVVTAVKDIFATELMPALKDIWETLINDLLPALKSIWEVLQPFVIPVLKAVAGILINSVKTAFSVIAGIIKTLAALLRLDFAGAWNAIKDTVFSVVRGILGNIKQMVDGASEFLSNFGINLDGVSQKIDDVLAAMDTTAPGVQEAMQDTATVSDTAASDMIADQNDIIGKWEESAGAVAGAEESKREAMAETARRNKEILEQQRADLITELGLNEAEWARYQIDVKNGRIQWTAELIAIAEQYGTDDLAEAAAHHANLLQAEKDHQAAMKEQAQADEKAKLGAQATFFSTILERIRTDGLARHQAITLLNGQGLTLMEGHYTQLDAALASHNAGQIDDTSKFWDDMEEKIRLGQIDANDALETGHANGLIITEDAYDRMNKADDDRKKEIDQLVSDTQRGAEDMAAAIVKALDLGLTIDEFKKQLGEIKSEVQSTANDLNPSGEHNPGGQRLSTGGRGYGTFLGSRSIESDEDRERRSAAVTERVNEIKEKRDSGELNPITYLAALEELGRSDLVTGAAVGGSDLRNLLGIDTTKRWGSHDARPLQWLSIMRQYGFDTGIDVNKYGRIRGGDPGEDDKWSWTNISGYLAAIREAWQRFINEWFGQNAAQPPAQAHSGGITSDAGLVNVLPQEAIMPLSRLPQILAAAGMLPDFSQLLAATQRPLPVGEVPASMMAPAGRAGLNVSLNVEQITVNASAGDADDIAADIAAALTREFRLAVQAADTPIAR